MLPAQPLLAPRFCSASSRSPGQSLSAQGTALARALGATECGHIVLRRYAMQVAREEGTLTFLNTAPAPSDADSADFLELVGP